MMMRVGVFFQKKKKKKKKSTKKKKQKKKKICFLNVGRKIRIPRRTAASSPEMACYNP
jgi:hypothetical protein